MTQTHAPLLEEETSEAPELHKVFEIKKHSALIQISNKLTLAQHKLINAIQWIIKDQLKRDPERTKFVIDL